MATVDDDDAAFRKRLDEAARQRLHRQRTFALNHREQFERLSVRERQVLALVAGGYSNQLISEKLTLSIHTVRTHRNNVWRRLGITSVVEAVWWGECFGLV